jgi:hypothetical protein
MVVMEVTSTFEGSTTSGSETTASGNDIVNQCSASGDYFYTSSMADWTAGLL